MAFERKYKGATEFLRASKRAGWRPSSSGDSHGESGEEGNAAFDGAVMTALMKADGDAQDVARAINAPPAMVENAIDRLLEQGFVEQSAKGKPCKLTEAGRRYLKYSRLTKY